MISNYTISVSNRDILLKKDDTYKEHEIYMDENKLYLGHYITIICDDGTKRKRKKIDIDNRYAYNIGISIQNDIVFIHLYKYIPFINNQYQFEYYHKDLVKWEL